MRKFTVTAALLGLTALGVVVPAATSQAAESAVPGPNCDRQWGPRNGYMYAWDGQDCTGELLMATPGNSPDWGNASNRASSVMNRGYTGNLAIVKFFYLRNYGEGHTCLQPGELYADNLTDNRFTSGQIVDNNIMSHQWVNGGCGANLT